MFQPHPVKLVYTDDPDAFPDAPAQPSYAGAWTLYKELKALGLSRHELQLIFANVVLGTPLRQVIEEQGWSSFGTVQRERKRILALIKKRWRKK